jgi:hypothetical protein
MDLYLIEMCPSRAVAIIYIANKKYAAERIVNGAIHRKSIRISECPRSRRTYDVDGPGIGCMTEFRALLAGATDSRLLLEELTKFRALSPLRSRWRSRAERRYRENRPVGCRGTSSI